MPRPLGPNLRCHVAPCSRLSLVHIIYHLLAMCQLVVLPCHLLWSTWFSDWAATLALWVPLVLLSLMPHVIYTSFHVAECWLWLWPFHSLIEILIQHKFRIWTRIEVPFASLESGRWSPCSSLGFDEIWRIWFLSLSRATWIIHPQ